MINDFKLDNKIFISPAYKTVNNKLLSNPVAKLANANYITLQMINQPNYNPTCSHSNILYSYMHYIHYSIYIIYH